MALKGKFPYNENFTTCSEKFTDSNDSNGEGPMLIQGAVPELYLLEVFTKFGDIMMTSLTWKD